MENKMVDINKVEDLNKEISLLTTGLSSGNPLNIGKYQARGIYWRPLQNGEWAKTSPLPADPLSILYYLGKGFKGKEPVAKTPSMGVK